MTSIFCLNENYTLEGQDANVIVPGLNYDGRTGRKGERMNFVIQLSHYVY